MSKDKKLKKMMRDKPLERKLGEYLDERFNHVSYLFKEGLSPGEILPELTTPEIYFMLTGASDCGTELNGAELKKVGSARMREELSRRKEDGMTVLEELAKRVLSSYQISDKITEHFTDYNQLRKHMITFLERWLSGDKRILGELKLQKEKIARYEWVHGGPCHSPDSMQANTTVYVPGKNCCIRLLATDYKTPQSTWTKIARMAVTSIEEADREKLRGEAFERYVFTNSMIQDVLRSRIITTSRENMEDDLVYFFTHKLNGFGVYDIQHRRTPDYKTPLCRIVLGMPRIIKTKEGTVTPSDHLICQQIMTPEGEYIDRFVADHNVYKNHREWEPFKDHKAKGKYRAFVENVHDFLEA
jgi:hypothetical protein